jgi:methyl-accepting chemotaxis protein
LRSLAEAAQAGGNFVDYIYANPDTGEEENKISYVAPIQGTNYLIGAGTYAGIINSEVSSVRQELDGLISNISNSLLIFAVITALIYALVIFLISRYISKNINKILSGMDKMSEGDLTYRLDIESSDEIGQLAQAYNQTASAQK